ncbi:unnamed protein product [Echinostoma caproni]|uniref:Protein FAM228A n=1 Tax=Echinostoma caproni TaxID=27848 RepID=A0A183A738_9TREM|nr:unnamed protein product [Echinostoma caproni]
MEEFQGPQVFNHYAKERPVTTNQTYGFFYRELEKESEEREKNYLQRCQPPEKLKELTPPTAFRKEDFVLGKKVDYFVAPQLKDYREECPISKGTSDVPDNRLTKIKGIQLWHGYTGALVNVKPC